MVSQVIGQVKGQAGSQVIVSVFCQVGSGQVRSVQVCPGHVMSCRVRSGRIRIGRASQIVELRHFLLSHVCCYLEFMYRSIHMSSRPALGLDEGTVQNLGSFLYFIYSNT